MVYSKNLVSARPVNFLRLFPRKVPTFRTNKVVPIVSMREDERLKKNISKNEQVNTDLLHFASEVVNIEAENEEVNIEANEEVNIEANEQEKVTTFYQMLERKAYKVENTKHFDISKIRQKNSGFFLDIELIEAMRRILKHCFNYNCRGKHLHDIVKLFGLANLYSEEFSSKTEEGYHIPNSETKILINLLALRVVTIIFSVLLENKGEISKYDKNCKQKNGPSLDKKLAKYGSSAKKKNLALWKTIFSISSPLEIFFDLESPPIKTKIMGTFSIGPHLPEITAGYPLSLTTTYFDTSKAIRAESPNTNDLSGGKEFPDKSAAVKEYFLFFEQIDKSFPLTKVIEIIIQEKNKGKSLSQEELKEQIEVVIQTIQVEFFNGKKFTWSDEAEFLALLYQ